MDTLLTVAVEEVLLAAVGRHSMAQQLREAHRAQVALVECSIRAPATQVPSDMAVHLGVGVLMMAEGALDITEEVAVVVTPLALEGPVIQSELL